MRPDIKFMTRKELEKLKSDVEKALIRVEEKEKKAALAAAQKAAAAHGFSLADITGDDALEKKTRKIAIGPRKLSPPKYRNPAEPNQTWTGKGRQPEWFKSAIISGMTADNMEIEPTEPAL